MYKISYFHSIKINREHDLIVFESTGLNVHLTHGRSRRQSSVKIHASLAANDNWKQISLAVYFNLMPVWSLTGCVMYCMFNCVM